MFVDSVELELIAGRGGNGVVAWRREKFIPKGGPMGGNGGPGGSILIKASKDTYSLDKYVRISKIQAENGVQGGPNKRQGRRGKDTTILVPIGTIIRQNDEILHDLTEDGQEVHLLTGGKGGLGNAFFKTSTHQAPHKCTPGKDGQTITITLELKLIADIGFIGKPNAGKSSLLSSLTAKPIKIGAYAFTTLHPNISYLEFDDFSRIHIADIPGIITDAHKNRGLGLSFLKHIERTSTLVFVLDSTDDPIADYEMLRSELQAHDPSILERPQIIALNKIDEPNHSEEFIKTYPSLTIQPISALTGEHLDALTTTMRTLAQRHHIHYI